MHSLSLLQICCVATILLGCVNSNLSHKSDADDLGRQSSFLGYIRAEGNEDGPRSPFDSSFRLAEQGDAVAQYNLGLDYINGFGVPGVPEDFVEAMKWWRKAADRSLSDTQSLLGVSEAQYNLGVMYGRGEGVPQDLGEAVKWYRKSGVGKAHGNLWIIYANGFRKRAEQGDAVAQYNLGVMYESSDYAEARKWYRKSADQGLADAMYCLGNLHCHYYTKEPWERPIGYIEPDIPKDFEEAYAWVNLSLLYVTSYPSQKLRDDLEQLLTPEQKARALRRSTELHKEIEVRKKAAGK